MIRLTNAIAACALAVLVSGCTLAELCGSTWPPSVSTPTPTPTPEVGTPTPTPTPFMKPDPAPKRIAKGSIKLRFSHLDRIPLSPNYDYAIIATLHMLPYAQQFAAMQGKNGHGWPVLELSMRGKTPAPCVAYPCGANPMGLVVRYTANIVNDDQQQDESQHCGAGINYWGRLPIPATNAGLMDVTISWDTYSITVDTGVRNGTWTARFPLHDSFALGAITLGSPWDRKHKIGWGWDALSQHEVVSMDVLQWAGEETTVDPRRCP